MSGIYIPDMQMPDKKNGTVIIIYPQGVVMGEGHTLYQAISVPDHGRLGDLDALAQKCDEPNWCVWLNEIEDSPTIIPADKEDTSYAEKG